MGDVMGGAADEVEVSAAGVRVQNCMCCQGSCCFSKHPRMRSIWYR